ncbi:HU family DNA-binding protein [Bacteroides sp. 51]|uniref:HU family DNA-binding protein n=1 Tax=Bacteroides sp. 51 TaxID=2302938 RepID=UPI0013D1C929|nr:HU family DNA-binding protein [Bacteroides sp. 51]NDV81384.1 DNA-binding protein [Bacteroides sp. 51]
MKARYTYRENPNPSGDGEKQGLHPRIVSNGTISTEKIFKEIAQASTYTVPDLEGMLSAITRRISHYLVEGYHVELKGIGYFSASLKSRPVSDKKEIRANSIYFDNINFRAAASFRKQTRGFVESAGKQGFKASSSLSMEECEKRLNDFLDQKGYITRINYSNITGRLKNRALLDLKAFEEQGVIVREGRGNRIFFVRPRTEEGERF